MNECSDRVVQHERKKPYEDDQLWWIHLFFIGSQLSGGPDEFVKSFHKIGKERFQCSAANVSIVDVLRWGTREKKFSLWARLAIVEHCRLNGWVPVTDEDFQIVFKLWQKWFQSDLEKFKNDFPGGFVGDISGGRGNLDR